MKVVPASHKDIERIMELYRSAQEFMIRSGNAGQWGHSYPTQEDAEEDIRNGHSFLLCEGDQIHGVFAVCPGEEPTYRLIKDGAWLNDEPYVTIHRVAGDGIARGIFSHVMKYCREISGNIRIDTHEKNLPMQKAVEREGFIKCGIITVRDGSPRIAYQWTKD